MAITKIPTSQQIPYYSEKIDLDGENFLLVFRWNEREGSWHLSLYQEDETPIALGMRLCVGWNPFRRLTGANRPLGAVYVHDTTASDVEPDFSELGTRVLVLYMDSDTVTAIEADANA